MAVRSTAERARLARERLATERYVWIATASPDGAPHLVPLAHVWLDDRMVVATPSAYPTVCNAAATGRARAALDGAGDVVSLDCDVEVVAVADAEASLVDRFAAAVGWDPRVEPRPWSLLVLTVRRGYAWSGPAEMAGRTIARDGHWLVD